MRRNVVLMRDRFDVHADLSALSRDELETYTRAVEQYAIEQQGKRREVEKQLSRMKFKAWELDAAITKMRES